jgi:hypothetical protein
VSHAAPESQAEFTAELAAFEPDRRLEAQRNACAILQGSRESPFVINRLAEELLAWLTKRPARLVLRPAPRTFAEGNPALSVPTRFTGDGMSVTMTDDQQVTYAVQAEDDKGAAVSDSLTWTADDNGAVLTVTPAADGMSASFAAVAPGTATITVTDGTLSASDLITVTAGAVASLVLTPGAPSAEAPAAPAAPTS